MTDLIKRDEFDKLVAKANGYNEQVKRTALSDLYSLYTDLAADVRWAEEASRLTVVAAEQAQTIATDLVRDNVRLKIEIARLTAVEETSPVPQDLSTGDRKS